MRLDQEQVPAHQGPQGVAAVWRQRRGPSREEGAPIKDPRFALLSEYGKNGRVSELEQRARAAEVPGGRRRFREGRRAAGGARRTRQGDTTAVVSTDRD